MKKLADKQCLVCTNWFSATTNDRPNSWEKRMFCSSRCCNSRKNKGQFVDGHTGYINSGNFKKGAPAWNKGLRGFQAGELNKNWLGGEVGYHALHGWVKRWRGKPTACESCKKDDLHGRQIHWANKSGEYKRDLNDWLRLCSRCHRLYDLKNNLIGVWQK